MKTAIVIPARYGSTRFPGKPLATIKGRTMLSLVVEAAQKAAAQVKDTSVFVTTEDPRIEAHAKELGVKCILTSEACATGSDRVLEAVKKSGESFSFVVNLQGDAPFTPPDLIAQMIASFEKDKGIQVITPVHKLSWEALDHLRETKKTTPFSGTTATIDKNGRALWFSKTIIPALRYEDRAMPHSPVYQHIGLYGFRLDILEKFCSLSQSNYEKLEGLEQLRLLENGITIKTLRWDKPVHGGIDSPEDLERLEKTIS
ncbi:MAG: 3-deoxy-manno-octulosonate cytidylyltransferase [Alphaproteobacteria bacterium]